MALSIVTDDEDAIGDEFEETVLCVYGDDDFASCVGIVVQQR